MEQNYQFRARMDQVHKPDIRDFHAAAATDETVIDSSWVISYNSDAPQSVIDTAKDLLDYFSVSMALELKLAPGSRKGIHLEIDENIKGDGTFQLTVTDAEWTEAEREQMREHGYDDMDMLRAWLS